MGAVYEPEDPRYPGMRVFRVSKFESHGLRYSGRDPSGELMEVLELPDHLYFVASQYHPEFKSRPERPAPVFMGLVAAARQRARARAA